MTEHRASCQCGAVQVSAGADPFLVAACNCTACRKKTGSAFGSGVFFQKQDVRVSGDTWTWKRTSDAGNELTSHFCPSCGTTVFWFNAAAPERMSVSLGCFDTQAPTPDKVLWGRNKADWLHFSDDIPMLD